MAGKSGVSLNWGGFDKAVVGAARRMVNRKALLATIGDALVSGTIERFGQEEAPDGTAWPLSHRAAAEGGKTLMDTARLRNSINSQATDDLVMVGSNVAYARIHQLGGKAGRGHKVTLPPRPYLGVSKTDIEEVKGILADFLSGAFSIKR